MSRPRNASRQTRALLFVMAAEPNEWRHGYELSKATGIKSGTLYPLLVRLSDQGLLEATWRASEQTGRPPRHVYRLTDAGVKLAREVQFRSEPDGLLRQEPKLA
jgi:PadR family transcriptional regulator PadR